MSGGGGGPVDARAHTVSPAEGGRTLAALLRGLYPALSWSKCRQLCRTGRVWVDGAPCQDAARRVASGARLDVRPTAPKRGRGRLAADAIVYVDKDVVVVNKPAGIMTVPFDGERDTLVDITRATLRHIKGGGPRAELGVVQRLDKETSGLLVFPRTLAAKRHLEGQLRARSVHRVYLALVHGHARDAEYDTLLVRDRGDGLRGSLRRGAGGGRGGGQRARTGVRVRERLQGATLVECKLGTGRQHQIRIHLSEAGHPLLGERVYVRDYDGPRRRAPRVMLHAAELGFEHPRTGEGMRFQQAPPPDFVELWRQLAAGRRP